MVGPSNSEDLISSLDLGNPLHLQNSDFNANTIISVKLTGTENYRVWAAVMKLAINTRNKTGFIDGSCVKSAYANSPALSNQWERCNSIVLSWLLNSVSEDLRTDYSLWREFDILTKLPKCSCAAREDVSKHNQLIKLMQFLMGLNDVFQPIKSSLLSRETLPDVKDAFAIVSREESHRDLASSSSGSADNNKRFRNSGNNGGPNLNLHCTNCQKVGHTVDRCFDIIGYPLGYVKNPGPKSTGTRTFNANSVSSSNEKGASLSFTNEHMLKLMNLINDSPSRSVQANMADSGANQHMTVSTLNMFGIIDISDLNLTVGHPNGTVSKIKYVRNLKLSEKKIDVLVVPEYCVSLLSINKLIKDSRMFVGFTETKCFIQDLHQNKIVGIGSENGGLYMLGHLSDQAVDMLHQDLNFTKDSHVSPCDIYYKAKQTREPFLLVIIRPLLLSVWIYLIKTKNEVYDHFVNYINMILNQFSYSIKTVRSDNGTELLPSSGQNGKSPVELVYAFKPKLSHLRSFRCMLNVTICNIWDLFQLDINNAFLYGDLTEDVYMTLPPGFNNDKSKSKYDYSLFTKKSDNVFIMFLVYVDDIVITGNDVNEIDKFKVFLKSKFQIKDLGKLKYFLRINKDSICLSQRKYCLELLHKYGLLAGKPVETLLTENTTLNHVESNDDPLLSNIGNYQRLVGKLIYLTNTRPDIAYVVHCLSQFMHSPLNSHLDAAMRVLRYLKSSPGNGIQINRNGNLKLRAYADSDWARCLATRKSVSGYCVFLGDSLVAWKSKKQSTLSRSSSEAEYRSMASATCEVIWLSNLLNDMGVTGLLHVVMYCDNSSALQIAANPVFHEKSKHFEIDVHLVIEKVASGVIKTEKIYSSQQTADILTKGLSFDQHKELCKKLGMLDMFSLDKLEGGWGFVAKCEELMPIKGCSVCCNKKESLSLSL
ncbi:ribonuclease H-like domain-containing protein [Tanacetum coccineum]